MRTSTTRGMRRQAERCWPKPPLGPTFVGKKATRLLELKSRHRDLLMFGPESASKHCPSEIRYHSIEDVFKTMDKIPEGRWLIDRMLVIAAR
jgi:hypothetical protein